MEEPGIDSTVAPSALKVMICAGEVSGDMHAAALIRALRGVCPIPLELRGFGGDAMHSEGVKLLFHTDQTGIMGITPVLRNLPFLLRMIHRIKREIMEWKPDVVLTVDYPGMNLRLACFAKRKGFDVVHYISPKVWAWHRGRIRQMARCLKLLLCIFPFEPELFLSSGLSAKFVGHPLIDRVAETRAVPRATLPWGAKGYRVALLPGSRKGEIIRILPTLLEAAWLLEEELDGECSFILPAPNRAIMELSMKLTDAAECKPQNIAFVEGGAREVILQSHAAAVASGTATLEACLLRCPTVLVYAVSAFTAFCARILIKGVRYVGLANIISQQEVMPELLQEKMQAERIAELLYSYLTDDKERNRVLADLDKTNALLGSGSASLQAAQVLVEFINIRQSHLVRQSTIS